MIAQESVPHGVVSDLREDARRPIADERKLHAGTAVPPSHGELEPGQQGQLRPGLGGKGYLREGLDERREEDGRALVHVGGVGKREPTFVEWDGSIDV